MAQFLVRKRDNRPVPYNPLLAQAKRFTVMYGNPLDRSTWTSTPPGTKPTRQTLLDRIQDDLSALGEVFDQLLERLPEELRDSPPSVVIQHVVQMLDDLFSIGEIEDEAGEAEEHGPPRTDTDEVGENLGQDAQGTSGTSKNE